MFKISMTVSDMKNPAKPGKVDLGLQIQVILRFLLRSRKSNVLQKDVRVW